MNRCTNGDGSFHCDRKPENCVPGRIIDVNYELIRRWARNHITAKSLVLRRNLAVLDLLKKNVSLRSRQRAPDRAPEITGVRSRRGGLSEANDGYKDDPNQLQTHGNSLSRVILTQNGAADAHV